MALTNEVVCTALFTKVDEILFQCKQCKQVYKKRNGWTNLIQHLTAKHPDYRRDADDILRQGNPVSVSLVGRDSHDVFRWIEWVVMDRLPISFCERPHVRKNTSLKPISAPTLTKYIGDLYAHTREKVAAALPAKFGLVLDGWSSGGRHFIAIFAVFDDPSKTDIPLCAQKRRHDGTDYDHDIECLTRQYLLLAFCPVEAEDDLSAQSIFDLVADVLSTFRKPWNAVLFMTADNCSVNQAIGRKEGAIPLIGCASHRFNLAMKDFLQDHESLLGKIHLLMKRLATIKGRTVLKRVTPLAPVLRNATRWSSAASMLRRFVSIVPALSHIDIASSQKIQLTQAMLSSTEVESATKLLDDLDALDEVTHALQDSTLTLVGVRAAFDAVISRYPQLNARLGPRGAIVNNAALESGLVKIIRRQRLAPAEEAECERFRLPNDDVVTNSHDIAPWLIATSAGQVELPVE